MVKSARHVSCYNRFNGASVAIFSGSKFQALGTTVWDKVLNLGFGRDRGNGREITFAGNADGSRPLRPNISVAERNSRKGRFCPSKLKGKRVIELGAGCGVASFGMAMLGCEVVTTDEKEVLSLLQRNVNRNTSWIMQGNANSDSFGSIKVAELDWGNKNHIQAVDPPYDYIIDTDVVYSEHLLEPLLQMIHDLSGPHTAIVLGYEMRSTSVHEQMLQM